MIYLKAALLLTASAVLAFGAYAVTSFYFAYPEAAPASNWSIVAAAILLWFASLFLISKLPDKN